MAQKCIFGVDNKNCTCSLKKFSNSTIGTTGRILSREAYSVFIGIDEAGRGPLAGPLVVAGVAINVRDKIKITRTLSGIKDSKKLSESQRNRWFKILTRDSNIRWAVSKIWPKVIDRINITGSANLGARRVCAKLSLARSKLSLAHVMLDGGLRLPRHISHETIIKGDEKVPLISAASIIAKVTRDSIMLRLHRKFPQYGFNRHKGYGTKMHRKLLRQFGISEVYRKKFVSDKKWLKI